MSGRQQARGDEPFVQLPLRLHDALRRGDIDLDTFAAIAYIAGECWRTGGEAVFSTSALCDLIGYDKTPETLLAKLKLAKPEWIDFELLPRQRRPITFRLTGAAVRQKGDQPKHYRRTAESEPPPIRQSSDESRQSQERPTPHGERVSPTPDLPNVASREGDRQDKRREEEKSKVKTTADIGCRQDDPDVTVHPAEIHDTAERTSVVRYMEHRLLPVLKALHEDKGLPWDEGTGTTFARLILDNPAIHEGHIAYMADKLTDNMPGRRYGVYDVDTIEDPARYASATLRQRRYHRQLPAYYDTYQGFGEEAL